MQIEHAPHKREHQSVPRKPLQAAVQQFWDMLYRSGELIVAMRDDNNTLATTVARLETEVDLRRQNYDDLAVQFARIQEHTRKLEERISDVKQRELLQAKIDEAITEKDARIGTLEQEVAAMKRDLEVLRSDGERKAEMIAHRDKLLERMEQTEREKKSLQDQLSELTQFRLNMEIMQKELARRNAEVNSRINEVQQYRNRVAEMDNKLFQIPKLQDDLSAAAARIAELTAELQELQKTHHQAAEYSRLYEIQQATLEAYSQKNLEYNVQLTARSKELEDARGQVGELEQRLTDERTVSERLYIELRSAREYEAQISQHLASLEQYAAQVVEVKKQNHLQEEQIRELTELLAQSDTALKSEIAAKFEQQEIAQNLSAKYEAICADLERKEAAGAEMEGTIAILRLEAEQSAATNDAKNKEILALQAAVESATAAKAATDIQLAAQTLTIEKTESELAAAHEEIAALQKEITSQQEQLTLESARAEQFSTELRAVQQEITQLKEQSASVITQHTATEGALTETIARQDEEIQKLTTKSTAQAAEIARITEEIATLRADTAKREESLTIDVGALTTALEAKTQEAARLSKEIADAWRATDDQKGIREAEREAFEGEKQSFHAEIREKEAEAKRLMERIGILEADYAREKDQSLRRIAMLNSERDDLGAQVAELGLRIEALAAESEAMRDELESEHIGYRAKESMLRTEVEQLREKIDQTATQLKQATRENVALREEVDQQKTQAVELAARLQTEQTAARRNFELTEEKLAAITAEKDKLADMVAVYREAQQDATRLNERNVELETEINTLTAELSKMRQALHLANQKQTEAQPAESAKSMRPEVISEPIGDQRDKVLGKIGDILSRLEGALQQEDNV